MMSTIFRVTLSDIPEDTEAVCPENEKITNIQTTAGRYQKYFRIILNIKLLYLSPPQILSIINSVAKPPARIRAAAARFAFYSSFFTVFYTKERTHMFKQKQQSTDAILGIAILVFMLILAIVSTVADSRN